MKLSKADNELIEAARIDGASEFGIYWRVILPLARPALAAQGVLTFLGTWNSFLWPLSVLRNREAMTLPVGLDSIQGALTAGSEAPIGPSMAAATLVTRKVRRERPLRCSSTLSIRGSIALFFASSGLRCLFDCRSNAWIGTAPTDIA